MSSSQIWKYILTPDGIIHMPKGARILTIQVQRDAVYMWAIVDPLIMANETRRFKTIPTGMNFDPTGLTYIGTFQVEDGMIVMHVFEEVQA